MSCAVLLAFAAGPFLAGALDSLSESLVGGEVEVGGVVLQVPGVRLTLWFAGTIMIVAGILAAISLRSVHPAPERVDGAVDGAAPATGGTPPTAGGTATGAVAGLLPAPGTTPAPATDGTTARAVGAGALAGGASTPSERSSAIADL